MGSQKTKFELEKKHPQKVEERDRERVSEGDSEYVEAECFLSCFVCSWL